MWTKMLYLAPVAAILSLHETAEEETLHGYLQEELIRVFQKNIHHDKFQIILNKHLHATINATYPAHSNLWTILDGVLQRYHLILDIKSNEKTGGITVQLLEGLSWRK